MRRMGWTICAASLACAVSARAEETPAAPGIALQAVAVEAGMVRQGEAGAKGTFVVDRCHSLHLLVAATEKIAVKLELPDGSTVAEGSGAPLAAWQVRAGDGDGAGLLPGLGARSSTLVVLDQPPPGRYLVHISRDGGGDVPFTITTLSDSRLRMGPWVASPYVTTAEPVALSVVIDDDGGPVRDAEVSVALSRIAASGLPERVGEATLRDDGRDGDVEAGDGAYSAIVKATVEGATWASFRARGRTAAGDEYERTSAIVLQASKARLALEPRGEPVWKKHGELVDALVLDFSAEGAEGDYDAVATVRAANGRSVTGGVAFRVSESPADVRVTVPSALVKTLGVDGPYRIESIEAYARTEGVRTLRARRTTDLQTPPIALGDLE